MPAIKVYLPVDLKLSDERIAELLEDFDYRKLPENPKFNYCGRRREPRQIALSKLGRAEINYHCGFYEKSFTTAIMQALTTLNLYRSS